MKVLCLLALVSAIGIAAGHWVTAADVVDLVFTTLHSDHDDARLAQELKKLEMSEQLSPRLIVYFRYEGVGPLGIAALESLRDKSANMKPPAEVPLTIQPLPSDEARTEMLKRVTEYAQSYVRNLPNFVCDQVTRRYTNLDGYGLDRNPVFRSSLRLSDSFTQSLRLVGGMEEAIIPHASGRYVKKIATKKGQALSTGEFGSDLLFIFGPRVEPAVNWHHWEMFKGKRTAVFSYFVGLKKSQFTLMSCCIAKPGGGEMQQEVKAAVQGLAYIDPETGVISRLTVKPVDLPATFRIKESETIIDYADVKIGQRAYILPVKAVAWVRSELQKNRNEIAFVNYRKFEAESVLTFSNSKITYETGSKK